MIAGSLKDTLEEYFICVGSVEYHEDGKHRPIMNVDYWMKHVMEQIMAKSIRCSDINCKIRILLPLSFAAGVTRSRLD